VQRLTPQVAQVVNEAVNLLPGDHFSAGFRLHGIEFFFLLSSVLFPPLQKRGQKIN